MKTLDSRARSLALRRCGPARAVPAPPAPAQKQAPPAPGAPKDFTVPAPTRFTLDNGMEVTLVAVRHTSRRSRVELAVRAGNVDEKRRSRSGSRT